MGSGDAALEASLAGHAASRRAPGRHPAVRAPYAALTSLQVSPAQECVGDTDLPPGRHLSPTDPDPE